MEMASILDQLAGELSGALQAMAKAKSVEEKLQYSQIVKSLSEAMGVFLGLASDYAADFDFEE